MAAQLIGDDKIGKEMLDKLQAHLDQYGGAYYAYQNHELSSSPSSGFGDISYLRVGGISATYSEPPEMIAPNPDSSKRMILVGKVDLRKGVITPITTTLYKKENDENHP